MDWGFLVGFTLGSIVLWAYHLHWLHQVLTSDKMKYVWWRSDMFRTMIDLGELTPKGEDEE